MIKIPAICWLLLSSLSFGVGEYLSKIWGMAPSWKMTICVIIPYIIGVLFWLPALLIGENALAKIGSIWNLLSFCVTIAVGTIIFHEGLTIKNIIGLVLAIISIILLS